MKVEGGLPSGGPLEALPRESHSRRETPRRVASPMATAWSFSLERRATLRGPCLGIRTRERRPLWPGGQESCRQPPRAGEAKDHPGFIGQMRFHLLFFLLFICILCDIFVFLVLLWGVLLKYG